VVLSLEKLNSPHPTQQGEWCQANSQGVLIHEAIL
jgi:hypothetical protein